MINKSIVGLAQYVFNHRKAITIPINPPPADKQQSGWGCHPIK
jgi:hypothetical protein